MGEGREHSRVLRQHAHSSEYMPCGRPMNNSLEQQRSTLLVAHLAQHSRRHAAASRGRRAQAARGAQPPCRHRAHGS